MKQCCEREVERLAATDELVDALLGFKLERDLAVQENQQAQRALRRVSDLHKAVVEDRKVWCSECRTPAPCNTMKALREPQIASSRSRSGERSHAKTKDAEARSGK